MEVAIQHHSLGGWLLAGVFRDSWGHFVEECAAALGMVMDPFLESWWLQYPSLTAF